MKPIEELNISPWPWKNHGVEHKSFGFVRVRDKNGFFVADAEGESDGNAHANGDIIAAAPEMYECLREAVNESCKMCYSYKFDGQCHLSKHDSCFIQRWRSVLAKAAGERK